MNTEAKCERTRQGRNDGYEISGWTTGGAFLRLAAIARGVANAEYRGTQIRRPSAASNPIEPTPTMPAASVAAEATSASATGPAAFPESLSTRQIPRNLMRP